jgi:Z1 domain
MPTSFYPVFLNRKATDDRPLYSHPDRVAIEATVDRLTREDTTEQRPGVLLGKIQSGKTKCFIAVMSLAFDRGFDITIILTKGTVALAHQTLQRVENEFAEFISEDLVQVFDIMKIPDNLRGYILNQKLIFTVKKQTDNLERLATLLLKKYPQLADRRILIIDDEADNASIGYSKVKEPEQIRLRRIAEQINSLRNNLAKVSFLQVTATPYSLYLQPEESPLVGDTFMPVRPAFTVPVPEHDRYIGGRFYFEDSRVDGHVATHVFVAVPDDELAVLKSPDGRVFKTEHSLTSPKITGLRSALVNFITGGIIRILQDIETGRRAGKFSFLVHTEAATQAHTWQTEVVEAILAQLTQSVSSTPTVFESLIRRSYDQFSPSVTAAGLTLPTFALVVARVKEALVDEHVSFTKVNSEKQIETILDKTGQLRLDSPLNIFIGGQILDRGITIAGLIGFYYGRNPKRFQQDTVLQHSRMYGARPPADCAVTRFYTTAGIYAAMTEMHEMDNELRNRIIAAGDNQRFTFIELSESGRVVHCSPNKILAADKVAIRPGKRFAPVGFQTDFKVRLGPITEKIDVRVDQVFGSDTTATPEKAVQIPLVEALEVFDQMGPLLKPDEGYESFCDFTEHKAILSHLSDSTPNKVNKGTVLLMVRRDRNRKRQPDDGASPFDTPDNPRADTNYARAAAQDIPVLMLLRQNGTEADGWRGCPFWWPVIFTPANAKPAIFAKR